MDVNHYAKEEVAARMDEVVSLWKKLLEATELKGKKMIFWVVGISRLFQAGGWLWVFGLLSCGSGYCPGLLVPC